MIQKSRTVNAKRNIVAVTLSNGGEVLLSFLARTAVLYILGTEYVGLSSLFSSILQIFNLADFGFEGAVVYAMYKPMAEGDERKVCAFIRYLAKIYIIIGLVILIAGLIVLPFVPNLINGQPPKGVNIYIIYIIFLIDSAVRYIFFAEYTSVLKAAQRLDLVKAVHLAVHILMYVLQIAVLYFTKNYYLYAIISVGSTFAVNLSIKLLNNRLFPEYKPLGELPSDIQKGVNRRIFSLIFSKIGSLTRTSAANIVISAFIGLSAVGVYGNYYYIMSGIYILLNFLTQALLAGIGNSIATETVEKNRKDFFRFDFIYMWITSVCTVCMCTLFQPVMRLWAGEGLVLSDFQMILFCIWFYIWNVYGIPNLYFSGNGLWWKLKYYYIAETCISIIAYIIAGYIGNISYILIVTVLSIIIFRIIPTIRVIFSSYFRNELNMYIGSFFKMLVVTGAATTISFLCCKQLFESVGIMSILLGGIFSIIVANGVLFISYFRTDIFKDSKMYLKNGLKRKQ